MPLEEKTLREAQARAVEALRESEARYRGLVENATFGIYSATVEGEILHANPALVQMLAFKSVEELLAEKTSKKFYRNPSDRERLVAEFLKTGQVDAMVDWVRKDGRPITVRLIGRHVKEPERSSDCVQVIVEDVTERVALEKQLVLSQKSEAIAQLAGGVAHDFNNMIGAILGWAELGMEETEPGTRLHRHFEKVRHQAERAASLTRQLLAFARRQVLEPRNIDLNQTVVETISLLEKVIGGNIEMRANLAPNLAVVCADPTQVEQVLLNLCINARDAMPQGGRLTIETRSVTFDERSCVGLPFARPGHYAVLSVTDTGTGMDAATLDRLFEPFFTTKEIGKGTGLGLATVYGIVRQQGGFVNVYSELGLGSTFRVYLPASSSPVEASASAGDSSPVRGGSETILLAEDHEGLRELARETLSGLGYHVLLAADGEQAVEEFRRHRDGVDLCLLDVVMPKLSGPEAYDRICREKPQVFAIFATGYSADTSLLDAVRAKGLPMIQKPYTAHELARHVREVLDQKTRQLPRD